MIDDLFKFQIECFSKQFQKACRYRGHHTYKSIMKKFNFSENNIQLIETGAIVLDIQTILDIANGLEIDLCFFFLQGANPQHFDLKSLKDDLV